MLSRAGVRARGVELELIPEGRTDVNALGYARAFDDPAFRGLVVGQLAGRRLGGDERIAFPAVLGIKDPHGVWTGLEAALGRRVFEVPDPAAVRARHARVRRCCARRCGGRAARRCGSTTSWSARSATGDRLQAVRVRVGLREERHAADWFVLASGGVASGGVELDSHWQAREVALGLDVAGMPAAGEPRFTPGYFDEQPMSRAGVAVDDDLRPVDADGERALENVLVAGATLAGAAPWKEKSGDGISLATGFRAAELILAAGGAPAGLTTASREGR